MFQFMYYFYINALMAWFNSFLPPDNCNTNWEILTHLTDVGNLTGLVNNYTEENLKKVI